jgi:ketosteroid isomerase-like protein
MSQRNIELVQEAMVAYFRDDQEALRELVTADVMVTTRPDQPDARTTRGYEDFLEITRQWTEAWKDWSFDVLRISETGDFVIVDANQTGQGASSGVPIEGGVTFVYTIADGKIARLQMFASEDEARQAVGLTEDG